MLTRIFRAMATTARRRPTGLSTLLRERMREPQRHRLLHGFPLAAAMPYATDVVRWRHDVEMMGRDRRLARGLLVGVLPHSFCNPKVAGCGFCTFPHEPFSAVRAAAVVDGVLREIDDRAVLLDEPATQGLYFGGGTANLTPAEPFRRLCQQLREVFDLRQAEVTLEGVPAYFLNRKPLLMDILREELAARHVRISMGVQTFSRARLEQMGRLAFGGPEVFSDVVSSAHARDMTVSADLLFNLPGQSLTEMKEDVSQAVDLGLDQICLYHLVLFRGLATPWARDPQLLASLPDNETAARNWEALREQLLARGFRQTTLTNFERSDLEHDARRYQYELMSFQPDRFDVLGFGPSAISYIEYTPRSYALKTMNPESSDEYLQAVQRGGSAWNRYFAFGPDALKLLYVTRCLAALRIDCRRYQQVFASDICGDYAQEIETLADAQLLELSGDAISLTARGMFYADSVAAVFAHRHLERTGHRLRSAPMPWNDKQWRIHVNA